MKFNRLLLILLLATSGFSQQNNTIEVNQITVPTVSITDKEVITFFLNEFFIPETVVVRMDIIDVGLNGFGENDIVKLYPSDNVYFLEFVSDTAQKKMNNWKFKANFQITANNDDNNSILENYETSKPAFNILGYLLKGLNKNYQDFPIKLRFERDSSTLLFELWGYNENLLKVIPDTEKVPDPILKQIEVKSDTTHYDCIFIYKTITDTVYINNRNQDISLSR